MSREEAIDRVGTSPIRQADCKETSIHFRSKQSKCTVESYEAPIIRSLLKNDQFEIDTVTIWRDSKEHTTSSPDFQPYDKVVGIRGKIPIGCVAIKSRSRSNNHHSAIVNY